MVNWQDPHYLVALTHLDGRNAGKVSVLRPYFSELAWMKERLEVMCDHLVAVAPLVFKKIPLKDQKALKSGIEDFSLADAKEVADHEKIVNHDLKALEMYLASHLPNNVSRFKRYILFGLGSEDVNAIALGRLIIKSRGEVLLPELYRLMECIGKLARNEKDTTMIARTHALPAGVTTFGKELANPLLRLCDEVTIFSSCKLQAKLSGEVGSFHGLSRSGIKAQWMTFADNFVRSQGLEPQHGSTQIVPYDSFIRLFQSLFRINAILIDLCTNIWLYVLLGYVRVVKKEKEVGSSGMPHKVNPIYFEGAQGGLVMANGMIETFARSLMVNRLDRDFSDSTIRRNTSLIIAYNLLSYQSLQEAFRRLEVNRSGIRHDLSQHAEVWVEPIKIIMLHAGLDSAYDFLKRKTRGISFTTPEFHTLIDSLPVRTSVKHTMHQIVDDEIPNPYPVHVVAEAVSRVRKLGRV